MKKSILTVLLLGLLLISPIQSFAQTPGDTTEPVYQIGDNEAVVNFQALGYDDINLISPYDSTRILFGTPPHWQLAEGAEVTLNFDVFLSGADVASLADNLSGFVGSLAILFNGNIIQTINISTVGNHSEVIRIPADALVSTRRDNRHELEIFLDAGLSCIYDVRTNVVIKSDSTFTLPFEINAPELDLARLPYPFYTRDSLLPETTYLVVPNEPDAGELEAAINVASGFGSMTGAKFSFELVSIGEVTSDMLETGNFIFVGRPDQFELLADAEFPLPIANGTFTDLPANAADDGIIQLANSPWEQTKAVLLVSGTSPEAVIKAAKAVSTGNIFTNPDPRLVFAATVNPFADSLPIVEEFSVKDLGYATETMSGIGTNEITYSFYIAKEQVNSENAYFDLIFTHTSLLDYNSSSLAVDLNGSTIASAGFTEESENLTTLRVDFPKGLLRFGENRLTVSANLIPYISCDTSGFSEYWVTVMENSAFNIPQGPPISDLQIGLFDLQMYPDLFLGYSNLSNVAFILPKTDSNAWDTAAQIAFNFGDLANPTISEATVAYVDTVPQDVLESQALILVSLPDEAPLLAEINDALPAPFDFETNTANEHLLQVSYRIPPSVNVGYLQLVPSPYSSQNPLLVVAGNSDEGVALAGGALTTPVIGDQLVGIFAITNGNQIATNAQNSPLEISTGQPSIVPTVVPDAEEVVLTPLPPALPTSTVSQEKPVWLLPVLLAMVVVLVLVIGYVIVRTLTNKKSPGSGL